MCSSRLDPRGPDLLPPPLTSGCLIFSQRANKYSPPLSAYFPSSVATAAQWPSTHSRNMASFIPLPHGCEAGPSIVQRQVVDPYVTMGQLSMAPATQTTVVTTTTTTTMSYPPFVMNAPRNLSERDSKEYPLAHAQAPESIRKFYFDAGGTQACFEEADNVADKMQQVRIT